MSPSPPCFSVPHDANLVILSFCIYSSCCHLQADPLYSPLYWGIFLTLSPTSPKFLLTASFLCISQQLYPTIVFSLSLNVPFKLHKRDGNLIGSVSLIHFKATWLVKELSVRQRTLCWPDLMCVPLCLAHTVGPIVYGKSGEVTCIRNPCEGTQK